MRKVILCILPKEFEFFAASLGTTGDEGGRGGTRGTTGRTGTTAMKEVCWVEGNWQLASGFRALTRQA